MKGGPARSIFHGLRRRGESGRRRRKRYSSHFLPVVSIRVQVSIVTLPVSIQVIRYQKQLQQNYIQMYRRNRELERVMRELSLELESRDMEEYEVHSGSNDIHFEEITATEI